MPELMATATVAYASTNVDGYALLLGFFSSGRYRTAEIVAGQLVSTAAQLALSVAIARSGWLTAAPAVGLAGIVPMVAGLKRIAELRRRGTPRLECVAGRTDTSGTLGRVALVASVATSSAFDNLLVYASMLAGRAVSDVISMACIFGLLAGATCICAAATAGPRAPVAALRIAAGRVAPFATTAVGVSLLVRFGTLPWIYSLA